LWNCRPDQSVWWLLWRPHQRYQAAPYVHWFQMILRRSIRSMSAVYTRRCANMARFRLDT
jgi:hypothetical protein